MTAQERRDEETAEIAHSAKTEHGKPNDVARATHSESGDEDASEPENEFGNETTVTYKPPDGSTVDEPTRDSHSKTTPVESAHDPNITDFGEYELISEVARGGMGVVFKARQKRLNRTVALKVILAGEFASQDDVQRFQTEAESAANLQHSGIVPIYEVGEFAGRHFFSMGYIDGKSLARAIDEGPLDGKHAAKLVAKIAEAIAYAHGRGVVHRDLKPSNILLDEDGEPRVTDFGLAKQTDADSQLTGSGQVLGTPR